MIGSDPLTNENAVSRQNDSTLERELIHSHTEHAHGQQLSAHSHVHDEESQRRIVNRLSRIEGHIRGIKTMVQENRACLMFWCKWLPYGGRWIGWRELF